MKSLLKLMAMMVSLACLYSSMASAQSISANESITVSIKGVPQSEQGRISGQYMVDSSGMLSLPLLKNGIRAGGRTASSIAKSVEAAYKKAGMYKDPRITIISNQDVNDRIAKDSRRSQEIVNVGGQVKSSGPKPFHNGMTLFDAVSAAGGANPFGALNRVELFHKGRRKIYNLKTAAHMSIRVYPGDSINVPQKNAWGK